MKTGIAIAATALSIIGLAGCSTDTNTSAPTSAATQQIGAMTLIDVRTPAEFAEGHLQGAVNIDVQNPDFLNLISGLDRNLPYSVYCRSGNRSAEAKRIMIENGFTNVTDLGSKEEASATTGVEIVQ